MKLQKQSVEIGPYTTWLNPQSIPKHRISYLEFGDPNNQNIVICAHGLTRNAYDFAKLGTALGDTYRVIALCYPGRGDSDFFTDKNHYNYQVYMQDTLLVLEKLNIKNNLNVIWLGTSMGGIIGMTLASKYKDIFKGMILNDIGPFLPAEVLLRIIKYASQVVCFDDLDGAKQHLKIIYDQFGISDEADWDYLTQHSFKLNIDGKYQMNYDPMIVHGVDTGLNKLKDVTMWPIWHNIECPILVIHGALSNILQDSTIKEMQKSRDFDLYTVDYAGHAPALMTNDQILAIRSWIYQIFHCKLY